MFVDDVELMSNDVDSVSQFACCEYNAEPKKSKTRLARYQRNSKRTILQHTRITGGCLLMMADTVMLPLVEFLVR